MNKKILFLISAVLLLAVGCNYQSGSQQSTSSVPQSQFSSQQGYALSDQAVATTSEGTITAVDNNSNIYTNNTYHFSFQIPKEEYASGCNQTYPVKVTETATGIEIGSRFTNCAEYDPSYLNGIMMYASGNIKNQLDANTFVQKVLGKGCEVSQWNEDAGVRTENDGNAFSIQSDERNNPPTMEQVEASCPFSIQKYTTLYSPTLGVIVFWGSSGQPEFPQKSGYGDIGPFKFLH